MHYLFTWTTGQPEVDAMLGRAMSRWEKLAARSELHVPEEWEVLLPPPASSDTDIPPTWATTFYQLPHTEQVMVAFAWLHWWQQSMTEDEPGFAGWLRRGPGFALNHVSFLKVLTQRCAGVLGILHGLLETVVERAGDWNGDRETGREVVQLLNALDSEYRYNVHDREFWHAVLHLVQEGEK
jgi:hypothetical protein